jgi:propionyl-CoA synthetase
MRWIFHIENGRGDQPALIYDSPVTDTIKTYTYTNCETKWPSLPGSWRAGRHQRRPGTDLHAHDPRSGMAMLACARIGAVHSVVFGGFAANELATRIDDAKPKVIVSAPPAASRSKKMPTSRCWMKPSRWRPKPQACIILQRPRRRPPCSRAATWTGTRR